MSQTQTHQTLQEEDARAGKTGMHVRIVLVASTALAIIALGIILFTFAH